MLPPSSIAVPGVGLGCPRATAISIAVSSGGLLAADSQKPSWGLLPRSISLADLHSATLSDKNFCSLSSDKKRFFRSLIAMVCVCVRYFGS